MLLLGSQASLLGPPGCNRLSLQQPMSWLPSARFCLRTSTACENTPSAQAKGRRSVSSLFCTFSVAPIGLTQDCASSVAAAQGSLPGCLLLGPAPEPRSSRGWHTAHADPEHQARVAAEVWACRKWQASPCYLMPSICSVLLEKSRFSNHHCVHFRSEPCGVGRPAAIVLCTQLRKPRLGQ